MNRIPLTLLFPLLSLCSCGGGHLYERDGDPHCVAARGVEAIRKEELVDALHPSYDTPVQLLVDPNDWRCSEWERQPYETVEQWIDRIHLHLCNCRNQLEQLQQEYTYSLEKRDELAKEVQDLLRNNETLRQRVSESQGRTARDNSFASLNIPSPPFFIHLVRPGETLYSIAMHYYGSGEMVRKILTWNQEWIRSPEELLAGVGLVLFPASYDGSAQNAVADYLRRVDAAAPLSPS